MAISQELAEQELQKQTEDGSLHNAVGNVIEGLLDDAVKQAIAQVLDQVKDQLVTVIWGKVREIVDKQGETFWAPDGWYAQHRADKIVDLPSPLPDLEVNDLRKVFELAFGPKTGPTPLGTPVES